MTEPLETLSIADLGTGLRNGSLTSAKITEHCLSRIAELDPALNAFITVTGDRAMQDAAKADRELADGTDRGPSSPSPAPRTTGPSRPRPILGIATTARAARPAARGRRSPWA